MKSSASELGLSNSDGRIRIYIPFAPLFRRLITFGDNKEAMQTIYLKMYKRFVQDSLNSYDQFIRPEVTV